MKKNTKWTSLAISSLVLVFTLTGLSFLALPHLQTQYSLKQFLPKQNLLLQEDEKTRETFQLSEAQPFVVTMQVSDSDWFQEKRMQSLSFLTESLGQLEHVRSALSLANLQSALNTENGLSVGPFLKSLPIEKWRAESLTNPLISPSLISADGRTASVIVNIPSLSTKDVSLLRQQVESKAKEIIHFAEIKIGGTPAVQSDVGHLLQTEIRNFVVLGFLACFVVLGLIFANVSPLIASFIVIFCANIWVLAVMALTGTSFSILSSTIPILTTVDVVSLCLHTLLRFSEEKKNHPEMARFDLVARTVKAIMKANLIASTTTMIGFLSLLTTNVPLIRDYGWTAAVSIVLGFIVTTLLLPALLLFLPEPKARTWAWRKARWGLYLFRRSGAWTLIIVVISLSLAVRGKSLSWSAKLFDDLPANHQVRLSTETIDKKLGGMIPVDIEISGQKEIWNDPALVHQLEVLLKDIRATHGVGSAVGLTDLIAAANIHPASRRPASRSSLAEIFFLYSLSNESPLKNFLNADSSKTRLAVRTQDLPGDQLHFLVEDLRQRTQEAFPELHVKATGMGSTIHELNNDLSHELIFGFWQSMTLIVVVLMFVFKSLRWALVACIPNLVPPAVLLGFLALSHTPIKPSVAIIFSIALGLAFNNTVYLLERLRRLQKDNKTLAIEKALWLEGNPCLISSLTLLAGFSVFMASYFAMNRIFGFYMLLSMLAGLVGDLILLPSLLKSCPWLLTPLTWKKEKAMALTGSLVLFFVFSFSSPTWAAAAPTVESIGHEMNQRVSAHDEEFVAQMKIIEADGSFKDREMKVWRLSPARENHSMVVRMQQPADLKGTALLVTLKNDQEDKWIYLPSSKQTRRLTGESSRGGILGSELSAEDFDFNRESSAHSVLKKEVELNGRKYYVIESDVASSSANYSKVVSYVAESEYLPIKVECFDKHGKLLKNIDFADYKKLPGNKWRAGKIKIRNVQNKRGTEIVLSQVKLNQNLKASRFTSKALADD